jgi:hypothetical protein
MPVARFLVEERPFRAVERCEQTPLPRAAGPMPSVLTSTVQPRGGAGIYACGKSSTKVPSSRQRPARSVTERAIKTAPRAYSKGHRRPASRGGGWRFRAPPRLSLRPKTLTPAEEAGGAPLVEERPFRAVKRCEQTPSSRRGPGGPRRALRVAGWGSRAASGGAR